MFELFNVLNTSVRGGIPAAEITPSGSSWRSQQADKNLQIKKLYENMAKISLICEALWELLGEHTGLTVEDLHKKLCEIDMRDGEIDGKNQRKAAQCPNCKHMVSPRHTSCLYCGQVMDDSVFQVEG